MKKEEITSRIIAIVNSRENKAQFWFDFEFCT